MPLLFLLGYPFLFAASPWILFYVCRVAGFGMI